MKNLRKRVFPPVPVLALLLSMAISAIKARTAARLTPCEEQQIAQPVSQKPNTVAARPERTAPRNLAIFIFDGVQIIDYTGPFEVLGQAHDGEQKLFNTQKLRKNAIRLESGLVRPPTTPLNSIQQDHLLTD